MMHLTARRLAAICESLEARLSGEADVEGDSGINREDYELALKWAKLRRDRKEKK